jgi:hypothetical protein
MVAILLSATLMAAQNTKQYYLRDKKKSFAIENMTSYVSEYTPDGTIEFNGSGKPLKGWSKEQGLEFEALEISGAAKKTGKDELFLERAGLSGNVVISLTRDLYGKDDKTRTKPIGTAKTVMTTASLEFNEAELNATVTTPGLFKVVQTETVPDGNQKKVLTLSGRRSEFTFLPLKSKSDDPLRKAVINGPVVLDYVAERDEKVGEKTERRTTKVKASGESMAYDAESRTLTLSGNILYEYTSPTGYEGEGNCDSLVVYFNDKNEIKKVRGNASAGKSTVKETGKGK